MTRPSKPLDTVLSRLEKPRRVGRGFVAPCPSHPDRVPSLSVAEGRDGRVLVYCHAGCTFFQVMAALGLQPTQYFPSK